MSDSNIEWTDKTWNPVTGCTKVSPGCAHCYAETVADRFWATQYPPVEYDTYSVDACCPITEMRPRQFTDVQTHPDRLEQPLRWKKPARIFVNSMSDLFHEDVPADFIGRVFGVMAHAKHHTFQVLTKRAGRMRDLLKDPPAGVLWPLPNVWLGVSVENQHFADERIPLLLKTPAAVRFISAEPLLGDVNLTPWLSVRFSCEDRRHPHSCGCGRLDWVIVGGESGPKARPFNVQWARSLVKQCRRARVPVFVKQLGGNIHDRNDAGFMGEWPEAWPDHIDNEDRVEHDLDGFRDGYQGALVRVHLRDRKGGDPSEWPEDLRVREFPQEVTR